MMMNRYLPMRICDCITKRKEWIMVCISVVFTKMVKDTAIFGEEKRKCNIRGDNYLPIILWQCFYAYSDTAFGV